jgi:hypothetical protein
LITSPTLADEPAADPPDPNRLVVLCSKTLTPPPPPLAKAGTKVVELDVLNHESPPGAVAKSTAELTPPEPTLMK